MADDVTIYRNRAEAEMESARAATLTNVRERCERAARAWSEMADRAERVAKERHIREAATVARNAAPASAAAEG